LVLLLTSCGLFEQVQRLGVSSEDGGMVVHYVPCAGEAVMAVRVTTGDPDEGDQVIWEVVQRGPNVLEARGEQIYPVGTVPDEFQESVALAQTPLPDAKAAVEVEVASEGGGTSTLSLTFTPSDLEPGRITTLGGTKDPSTFEADALGTCGD
jgi:hypothetical protein